MNYEKFVENVQVDLMKSLSDSYKEVTIEPVDVSKLQGQSYSGLSVRHDDSIVAETLNLDQFYEKYQTGTSYEAVLQELVDTVVVGFESAPEVDLKSLADYEAMKSQLAMQIVGAESNADKLVSIPHQMMEDMAVVYRLQLGEIEGGQASILVTNQMMNNYGITQEQLHQDAVEAMQKREPLTIQNMDEIMYEMTGGFMGSADNPESPMWVASNESRFNGATVMAYPDFMDQAAQKLEDSFYILPSSTHEILMIPDSFEMKAKELKEMVTQVNASEVSEADKLTDNVYHYDANERVFEQADKFEQRMEKAQERKSVLGELSANKNICKEAEPKTHKTPKKDEPAL